MAFRASLRSIKGIGPWTTEYVSLRALGDADAFPAADLVLRRAIASDPRLDPERVRPWRGYAAAHLWRAWTLARADRRIHGPCSRNVFRLLRAKMTLAAHARALVGLVWDEGEFAAFGDFSEGGARRERVHLDDGARHSCKNTSRGNARVSICPWSPRDRNSNERFGTD